MDDAVYPRGNKRLGIETRKCNIRAYLSESADSFRIIRVYMIIRARWEVSFPRGTRLLRFLFIRVGRNIAEMCVGKINNKSTIPSQTQYIIGGGGGEEE